ncbi:MAG: amidohydrolase [Phycisphaerales bacterium]
MSQPGDLIITNARVLNLQDGSARLSNLIIQSGIITAINIDVQSAALPVFDAEGAYALPGFIDTHVHLLMAGESLLQTDLSNVKSRQQFEDAVADAHAQLPRGEWLIARGWSNENWHDHALPDATWLAAAGDRPAIAWRMDTHVCLVNHAVIEQLNLSQPDPPGGHIVRDQHGNPTGLFLEAAAWQLVQQIVPPLSSEMRSRALNAAVVHAHQHGITAVGSMEYAATVSDVINPARQNLSLRIFLTLLDRTLPLDFTFSETFDNDDRCAIIGYKSFLDGTIGSRTARMLDAYSDDRGNHGMWCEHALDHTLDRWIHEVASRGWQPAMHAIGDAAFRRALDAIATLDADVRRHVRPRIEHAQQIDQQDLLRLKALDGMMLSMQPLHRADDGRYLERRVGSERLMGSFACVSLLDHGAVIAFGSDWPIVSCNPIKGMHAAITGRTLDDTIFQPQENITPLDAIRGWTKVAAHALHAEKFIGTLELGKAGDVVLLDRDPCSIDWNDEQPSVVATVAAGVIVSRDGAASGAL